MPIVLMIRLPSTEAAQLGDSTPVTANFSNLQIAKSRHLYLHKGALVHPIRRRR